MTIFFKQLMKFGFTGVLNTCIDYGLFNLLLVFTGIQGGWQLGLINVFSVSVAAANSYLLNRKWTFQSNEANVRKEISKFILATGLGMLINSLVVMSVSTLSRWLPVSIYILLNAGKIMGAIFSASWNFILYRYWVFDAAYEPEELPVTDNGGVNGLLSIVVPAYNESSRLDQRLRNLASWFGERCPVEILVVDDGSSDNTQDIAVAVAGDYPFIRILSHEKNQGKGAAVRTGVLESKGEYIVFVDADNSFSPASMERIIEQLLGGSQVVIGKRRCSKNERVVGESPVRKWRGKGFNLFVQAILLPGLSDTQCGLKGFNRKAAREIFLRQRLQRFAFDVEVLALARRLGMAVNEVAVQAHDCIGSTVNPFLSPLQMVWDVLRVRVGLMLDFYQLNDRKQWPELAIGIGLFVLALAVRLPWLWQIPRYIDELREVALGYSIYLGEALPLHNAAQDIGAMHNYILAAIFAIFGPNIYLPRLYVAVTGALTVVLLYRLGFLLFDRWTGLVAAGLLLSSGMHIMVTHMAWANCTTPFFFTLALLATEVARHKKSGGWLLAASLLWAATLQTHSSAVIYVSVAAVYILSPFFRSRASIKAGWYYGGILLFLAGYFNMIYFNIVSRGGSIRWLSNKGYAMEQQPGVQSFFLNLEQMLIELVRSIASIYAEHTHLLSYLLNPLFLLALLLLLLGSWAAIKKQQSLPVWMLLGGMMVIPWINHRYTFYLATRYIMPLIICALLLLAVGVVFLIREGKQHVQNGRIIVVPATAILLLFIVYQLFPFYSYCARSNSTNLSNQVALQVMSVVNHYERGKTLVLIDRDLPMDNYPLPHLLALSRMQYLIVKGNNPGEDKNLTAKKWSSIIEKYGDKKILAVMGQKTYQKTKIELLSSKEYSFKSRVMFPKRLSKPRVIYVVEIAGKAGTQRTNYNPGSLLGYADLK
ncbi:MAG: glycosyltransferase [Syntrophomonas sp.]